MNKVFARLGKESLIYGFGGIVGRFIGFFLLPIYTRVFSSADYGTIDVISTTTSLISILLTSGITPEALSYYYFEYPDNFKRRQTVTTLLVYLIAITGILSIIAWFNAYPFCIMLFKSNTGAPFLRIAVSAIPFTCSNLMFFNLLRLQRRPGAYIVYSLSLLVASAGLTIWFVVGLHMGVAGVFKANVIIAVVFFVVGAIINRSFLGFFFSIRRLQELFRYGAPLLIGGLTTWITFNLDRYFLVRLTNMDTVGIYSVGLRIASAMAFVTSSFRLANAPFQLEIAKTNQAVEIYSRTFIYYCLGTGWCMVALSLAARPVLFIMTTPVFALAFVVVPFAAFTAVTDGMLQIVSIGLMIKRKTTIAGLVTILGAIVNILLLLLLVPLCNIVGAALAVLLSNVAMVVVYYMTSQKVYRIPFALKRMVLIYGTSALFIAAGFALQHGRIINDSIIAIVAIVSWPLFAFFFGIIHPQEKMAIVSGIKRFTSRKIAIL
jgi:O-antigen/teichoic acid export membrane protein